MPTMAAATATAIAPASSSHDPLIRTDRRAGDGPVRSVGSGAVGRSTAAASSCDSWAVERGRKRGSHRGLEVPHRNDRTLALLCCHLRKGSELERGSAGEKLVQHGSERIHVCGGGHLFAGGLLRGEVGSRPENGPVLG